MTNEYGAELDRNGYAASILQHSAGCYICGKQCGKLERHEPFGGGYRQKSKRLGMWVMLCHDCHTGGAGAAHNCRETAERLKIQAQAAAMLTYGMDTSQFIIQFGKNYLEELYEHSNDNG